MDKAASYATARMKDMQAYIGIRAPENVSELGAVPSDKMKIYMEHYSNRYILILELKRQDGVYSDIPIMQWHNLQVWQQNI